MAALNFPASPTNGQTYTANGKTWIWNGTQWAPVLVDLAYTGTLTGGTGIVNIGSGQIYKDASGNVGIGESAPDTKLVVSKISNGVNNIWQGGDDFIKLFAAASSGYSEQAISFQEAGTNIGAKIGVKNRQNGAYDIILANRDNSSSTSTLLERMRIAAGGNVGIGTSSPTAGAKLDVNGSIKIGTGTSSGPGFIFTNTNWGMLFQAHQASPALGDFTWLNSAGTERMTIGPTGTWTLNQSGSANTSVSFNTTVQDALTLDSSGNFGIGQASTGSKLHINGSSLFTGTDGTRTIVMGVDANEPYFGPNTNNALRIISNNTERLRVKSTGQIRFVPLASDPAGAENGDMYYNSTSNTFKVYQNGAWKTTTTS